MVERSHENGAFGIFCLLYRDLRRKIVVKVILSFVEGYAVKEAF